MDRIFGLINNVNNWIDIIFPFGQSNMANIINNMAGVGISVRYKDEYIKIYDFNTDIYTCTYRYLYVTIDTKDICAVMQLLNLYKYKLCDISN